MLISLSSLTSISEHHRRRGSETHRFLFGNMIQSRKYLILCAFLFYTSAQIRHSHQANGTQQPEAAASGAYDKNKSNSSTSSSTTTTTTPTTNSEQQQPVDDILKDTFMLLDVLDQKLASVSNKTPNAIMRDNLRALDDNADQSKASNEEIYDLPSIVRRHPEFARLDDEASIEEALVRLAVGFSPGRKNGESSELQSAQAIGGESMFASASNERSPAVVSVATSNVNESSTSAPISSAPFELSSGETDSKKAPRQLIDDNQLTSDSTERHIKFTLDLMQSIFSSQLYSSKTNTIESFLISPLSIQMVLMMMHLGARGQTRREIGNCLHLNALPAKSQTLNAADWLPTSTESTNMASKLKRRIQVSTGSADNNSNQKQSNVVKSTTARPPHSIPSASQQRLQEQQQLAAGNNAHELFGSAMRNLLKDSIVTKALTSANQIFLQKNLPLSSQYDSAIKHYYAADVKQVDFQHQSSSYSPPTQSGSGNDKSYKSDQSTFSNSSLSNSTSFNQSPAPNNIQQMINEWIERQTRGRISNFLTSPISTSTLMMAINVLHFKGDWQYKFDPAETEPDAWFTQANGKTIKLPMMASRLPLAFAHDPVMKTSVIELPYKAQRLGLFLLLPDEMSGIFHTMQMLNSTSFANLISSMRKSSPTAEQGANGIYVRIPRFSIESSPRLSQILSQQLGLKTLFSPDIADLSGMFAQPQVGFKARPASSNSSNQNQDQTGNQQGVPPQVGLDELIHKAVLQVDEQGSVAAASSATIMERVGLFNGNYFEADHPFLLFLMDKQTGLVLFSGAFAGSNTGQTGGNNPEVQKQRQQQQ